jgi:predicted transcriptional regulator
METAKTTLRLPRELVKELKRVALDSDRSLQEVAREAFEEYLQRRQRRASRTGSGAPRREASE